MKISKFLTFVPQALLAGLVFATCALADPTVVNYSVGNGFDTAVFTVKQTPTPASATANYFSVVPDSLTINGASAAPGDALVYFFASSNGGGLDIVDGNFDVHLFGDQLFAGLTSSPILLAQKNMVLQTIDSSYNTLNASIATAPEPSTLGVFGLALAGLAAQLVRRRKLEA